MRGGVLSLWALLLTAVSGWADLTVTQEVESAGGRGAMTIRIQGAKTRADLVGPFSVLVDGATGETIYLQHEHKTFSRVSAEESRLMAEKIRKASPQVPPGKLEVTTQWKEISGFQAQLHVWTIGALKLRFWMVADFPNAGVVQAQLDRLQNTGLGAAAALLMPPPGTLHGLRLRTEMEAGPQKVSYTITGLKAELLKGEIFAVPAGYAEVPFAVAEMPVGP